MLSVEKRFMIKDLHHKGWSISAIARKTGNDRMTIRKMCSLASCRTAARSSSTAAALSGATGPSLMPA
jgi:IS30 family transposase